VFTYEYNGDDVNYSRIIGPLYLSNYYEFMHLVTMEIVTKLIDQ